MTLPSALHINCSGKHAALRSDWVGGWRCSQRAAKEPGAA